jgi:hypothetical protein
MEDPEGMAVVSENPQSLLTVRTFEQRPVAVADKHQNEWNQ